MEIFLDTGNLKEIEDAVSYGIVSGVTTNPTLLSKENKDYREILKEICEIVKGPVSAEVVSTDKDGMIKEARELKKISEHIVIKIPCIEEGIKAAKILEEEGIPVNMTLVFSPLQALLAAKAGVSYVSPFVGRLDDIGHDGSNVVEQIVTIYKNYGFDTKIIFASVRHPNHVLWAAMMGVDIATMPYRVFKQLIKHPLTDIGLEKFLKDWEKVKKF